MAPRVSFAGASRPEKEHPPVSGRPGVGQRDHPISQGREIRLLWDHLVEKNVDYPSVKASLGVGAGGRVMVLQVTQEDVQLVPEPLCLRFFPCAQPAPTRTPDLPVASSRLPSDAEDDRVASHPWTPGSGSRE